MAMILNRTGTVLIVISHVHRLNDSLHLAHYTAQKKAVSTKLGTAFLHITCQNALFRGSPDSINHQKDVETFGAMLGEKKTLTVYSTCVESRMGAVGSGEGE